MQKNGITSLKTDENSRLLSLRTYQPKYRMSPSKRKCAYSISNMFPK